MAIAVSSGGGIADTNDAASRSRRLMAWMYLAARSLKRARRHRCLCLISLCRRRPAFCPARTARTAGVRRQARTPRPTQPSPCPARCADMRRQLARTARFPHTPLQFRPGAARGGRDPSDPPCRARSFGHGQAIGAEGLGESPCRTRVRSKRVHRRNHCNGRRSTTFGDAKRLNTLSKSRHLKEELE